MKNKKVITMILALVVVVGGYFAFVHHHKSDIARAAAQARQAQAEHQQAQQLAAKQKLANDECANSDDKTIVVSVSDRHLWACDNQKRIYDSKVVTGYLGSTDNATPPGNYEIYAKQTDRSLTGSDDLGSWNDFVHYWMPFYGDYGFHDATWRKPTAFGQIDPHSKDASHGCVELPLDTAAWLYDWSSIGTKVVIKA